MAYETLLLDRQDGVTTVTLNRPNKRNAMSPRLHEDMTAALEELRKVSALEGLKLATGDSAPG